jgi:hypothetical protein
MERIRTEDFLKKPGIAETLDWAAALLALNKHSLDSEVVESTLGCIFKNRQDLNVFRSQDWSTPDQQADFLNQIKSEIC